MVRQFNNQKWPWEYARRVLLSKDEVLLMKAEEEAKRNLSTVLVSWVDANPLQRPQQLSKRAGSDTHEAVQLEDSF